ncbi:globin family protein [Pleurocapsa sp. FMAR1]|uniref:globin family protein n=1 Tax=Pleurocapsa sp. FMAR1 TaxID=3040204 RepID=UPI0029C8ABE9|nr:globin family protein [Pleurocapsa sp. FMAR1]
MTLKTDLLETSFALICDRETDFTNYFYSNLFKDYPEVKPLFSDAQMDEQAKKLFDSLVLVVNNLTKPDTLTSALKGLGAKHVQYGVLPEHYPKVGGNLLKTMAVVLEDQWTDEYAVAWTEAYSAITEIMLDGCNYPPEVLNLET